MTDILNKKRRLQLILCVYNQTTYSIYCSFLSHSVKVVEPLIDSYQTSSRRDEVSSAIIVREKHCFQGFFAYCSKRKLRNSFWNLAFLSFLVSASLYDLAIVRAFKRLHQPMVSKKVLSSAQIFPFFPD